MSKDRTATETRDPFELFTAPMLRHGRELFAAWESAATESARELVRDPRVLACGAAAMRSQLLWKQAMDATIAAAAASGEAALAGFMPATKTA